jgi:hypothetical protein
MIRTCSPPQLASAVVAFLCYLGQDYTLPLFPAVRVPHRVQVHLYGSDTHEVHASTLLQLRDAYASFNPEHIAEFRDFDTGRTLSTQSTVNMMK